MIFKTNSLPHARYKSWSEWYPRSYLWRPFKHLCNSWSTNNYWSGSFSNDGYWCDHPFYFDS